MSESSTRPVDIEGMQPGSSPAWQRVEETWSFGASRSGSVIAWSPPTLNAPPSSASRNQNGPSTVGPQRITRSNDDAAPVRRRNFGQRGLQTIAHWEGVIESVSNGNFTARMIPLAEAARGGQREELAEFSEDDLANESDRELIQPGAVFYWTIGRARNTAGTVTNVSLVRMRRLPPPSRARMVWATREASEMLKSLGAEDEPGSAGR